MGSTRLASILGQAIGIAALATLAGVLSGCGGGGGGQAPAATPNILFIIMDDVGIDQMQAFGYGGATPPSMPSIAQVAGAGIRFHNAWSMPACSNSRAAVFTGRFPLRTDVLGALGPDDLANSMVSPYEMTTPKLLAQRGYESALFGKFHLALQGHNPAGYAMPRDLGWSYFAGWLDETGDPPSTDTTAGGVAAPGTWSCGFVPGAAQGGADSGACYAADGACRALASSGPVPPGRSCRDEGGIFDPGARCQQPPPGHLDFTTLSSHFVSPLVINHPDGSVEQVPSTDPRARRFRATADVDAAIEWINARPDDRPWMATVSFASAHTPIVQPPVASLPASADSSDLDCADALAQRELANLMIESIDAEVGRLLVATGLARRGGDGQLIYRPGRSDTMVVVVGDNGSLGNTVKLPFDVGRSKGTAYQTGVWVPLIVAGPLVERPGRVVTEMVNVTDLYALFAEIAGIEDVRAAVPRPIDAVAMLPYVVDPDQDGLRQWNFTQIGTNLQANGAINAPCGISAGCTQIPVSKSVCEDNGGVWWGVGADDPITAGIPAEGYQYCCQVNAFRAAQGESLYEISPLSAVGIRNDRYKIVENFTQQYESADAPCVEAATVEFFAIDQAVPEPQLDREGSELPLDALTAEQQENYDRLAAQLDAILASAPPCPGDGNIDGVVDDADLDDWRFYSDSYGLSSVYDLNLDGLTDAADQSIIQQHLGLDCRPSAASARTVGLVRRGGR